MKKFKIEDFIDDNGSIRIKTEKGIFNALSSDSALFYNNATREVESCLWMIDKLGILHITFGNGENKTYILLNKHNEMIMTQEIAKKDNGKYSKKEEYQWENLSYTNPVGNLSIKERLNYMIFLIMVGVFFIQLIGLSVMNSLLGFISISNFFIFVISLILYFAMLKTNFLISERIFKKIKPYLDNMDSDKID